MTMLNKVTGVVVGQYGIAIVLRALDDNGQIIDLSTYTGVTVRIISDDAQKTLSFTGALVGGGSGGQFSFTPLVSNTFDRPGTWIGQGEFTKASTVALTVPFEVIVEKRI